ncbi:RNA-binding S4 domain-containing protein [Mycoplasmopsis cynos]|uniref:RNA-binding S4 domain-containing protein n=1 Tax=Mycoplasmopsis cynos TaxID=171284 RepID=UPI0024C8ECE0|nr:RNA-binding S4 domain-containing protein [Mycoplasmopsis cynos]WAM11059.1 RNA-binding S4 domain-containing protein [Mycoplasmopsis cynos]
MIIKIKSEFIKISQLLKFSKIINTGGEIKKFLEDNHVTLNGKKITSRSSKVKLWYCVNKRKFCIEYRRRWIVIFFNIN